MTGTDAFDILNSPLEGTNLIEAGAGTGKTYTITGLFLRLILEKNLSVDEILVVTFTEAATGELKERIRDTLRACIAVFSGEPCNDSFLNGLVEKQEDLKSALQALKEALRAFDQAAIFTIHGFCKRMLRENAFESGSLFDTELITDQEDLKREIVDDFWRKHLYRESPLFVNYAMNNNVTPDGLFKLIDNRVTRSTLKIIPTMEYQDSSLQEKDYLEYFEKVGAKWRSARDEVEEILSTDEGLNRTRYKKGNIPLWVRAMDVYVSSGGGDLQPFKEFNKFTSGELKRSVKQGYDPPSHPFFETCETFRKKQEALKESFGKRILALKAGLFQYMHDELVSRKKDKNIQSFDDLLLRLHEALEKESGKELAGAIREKFKAALIDEFQDTDPVQYAIFNKVFNAEKSILFLIGDPKQAIYSFRGADIFAYMKAAKDVESRYTLGENWRSTPALIDAVNAIFSNAENPFVYDAISFQKAVPALRKDQDVFKMGGKSEPPLQVWFINAGKMTEGGKALAKAKAYELIPGAVAAEISRLFSGGKNSRYVVDGRPLRAEDIAVLVRTNREALLMQDALSLHNIPCVLFSTENIFSSHEAMEMERLLSGIAEPDNENLIRGALATDIMGVSGENLDHLREDEVGWEKRLIAFREYHDLWHKKGFIRMFRHLLSEEDVMFRLMSLTDGERRNTNILHLSEILHQASVEKKLTIAGLLKWLSRQRDSETARLDEHQLRLESDENAVKLVTVHKSKGLEYPVVFCPFTWGGSKIKNLKVPFMFHNEGDRRMLTFDLGSEKMAENRVFAEKEQLAENLRLLYVALTRAKKRCYLVWGRFNKAETSAPAYLFHRPELRESRDVITGMEKRFKTLDDDTLLAELKNIQDKAGGTISISEMPIEKGGKTSPAPDKAVTLVCRNFSGDIDSSWRLSSFSSLVSSRPHSSEMADYDDVRQRSEVRDQGSGIRDQDTADIFSFPRGARAGTFLHDIFEHLDFAESDPGHAEKLVEDKLRTYGFDPAWWKTICNMINRVLTVPLKPDASDFTLSRIGNQDRLSELEFYFPLKSITPKTLKGVFAAYKEPVSLENFPERIGQLHFMPVRGFMKGFIDMVFHFEGRYYLVDWKSNYLGGSVEDYGQDALVTAMDEHYYVFQYYIYTVALNQYLKLRLPGYDYEKHFGGVFYIFLRGVDPAKGLQYGIYSDRPSAKLINELGTAFIREIVSSPHF
ncbi:MAG: exodeoxyribonuclease V subunit beta [Syntrophobacterales bacterium]|nr:exodeoxyribonuclease V subunit beta [Syntrophobacterales bacterium]